MRRRDNGGRHRDGHSQRQRQLQHAERLPAHGGGDLPVGRPATAGDTNNNSAASTNGERAGDRQRRQPDDQHDRRRDGRCRQQQQADRLGHAAGGYTRRARSRSRCTRPTGRRWSTQRRPQSRGTAATARRAVTCRRRPALTSGWPATGAMGITTWWPAPRGASRRPSATPARRSARQREGRSLSAAAAS